MKKRIGVIAIVVENRKKVAAEINQILSEWGEIIIGRMGVPCRDKDISTIALIVEGNSDDIGGMTGKIGNLPGVTLKSALTSKVIEGGI